MPLPRVWVMVGSCVLLTTPDDDVDSTISPTFFFLHGMTSQKIKVVGSY